MAEYRVKMDKKTGRINAGTMTKDEKWNHKSDVTNEVLEAARDHLLFMTDKEKKDICMGWEYQNGKTLILKLELKDSNEVKVE